MNRSDVEIVEKETAFQGYFRIDRYLLRHRRFDGTMTGVFSREMFERGHAVAVLLYDPDRDAVVLVEQFRMGAFAAGHPQPWLLEVVAGIIDEGETPDQVALRETREESGCTIIGDLVHVYDYLASPGGTTETVRLYCGRVDSRKAGGTHGLAEENEDIKVHVLPAEDAIRLLDDNRLPNATTVIALGWLARNRQALRQRWGVAIREEQPEPRFAR